MPAPVALPGEVVLIGGHSQAVVEAVSDADAVHRTHPFGYLRQIVYVKRVTRPRPRGRPGTAAYRHRQGAE